MTDNKKKQVRMSKDAYYLEIAKAVALRSTCLKRQYGAVIVNNDEIISTGYNGAPRGGCQCCDMGYCYKDRVHTPVNPDSAVHGEQYGSCVAREIRNAKISFISLVDRAANKKKFLIIKQEGEQNTMAKIRKSMTAEEVKKVLADRLIETVIDFIRELEEVDPTVTIEKSSGKDHYLKGIL